MVPVDQFNCACRIPNLHQHGARADLKRFFQAPAIAADMRNRRGHQRDVLPRYPVMLCGHFGNPRQCVVRMQDCFGSPGCPRCVEQQLYRIGIDFGQCVGQC